MIPITAQLIHIVRKFLHCLENSPLHPIRCNLTDNVIECGYRPVLGYTMNNLMIRLLFLAIQIRLSMQTCTYDTYTFGGSCYEFNSDNVSFVAANKSCQESGYWLVAFSSQEEFSNLSSHLYNLDGKGQHWIGGYKPFKNGNWKWTNGEPWRTDVHFWRDGFIGGYDCALIQRAGGQTFAGHSRQCDDDYTYICEKYTENTTIKCTPDIDVTTTFDKPSVHVTWPFPNATVTDNSGIVRVQGSHEPGSNFSIGVTAVMYEAFYPSGKVASCSFSVTVKAIVRPIIANPEGIQQELSISHIIESFNKLSEIITGLDSWNVSHEESQALAEDILTAIDEDITAVQLASVTHENSNDGRDLVTASVLRAADNLAKYILPNTQPGSGPIVLDKTSIGLNLESDSIDHLTNTTIAMGDGNGCSVPAADKLVVDQTNRNGTLNRIVKRLKRMGNGYVMVNDVLALSFTDRVGDELEVKNTKEDIKITFATVPPGSEMRTLMESLYRKEDNSTYFGSSFNISQLLHATIIVLENSKRMYGNASAYISNDEVVYAAKYQGYAFAVDVNFHGDHSSIFIPENYFSMLGKYHLTFSIPEKQEVQFSMAMKQTRCTFLDTNTNAWDGQGCKVSSTSNMTSTVCLCNHLTVFSV
ncbi:polycystin-1-like protein 2 [Ptychodera flava]|uniref:polycystin-1-like protein 2 n=1 Tax=Ptychodera flava TaxID=63121 RepID=UPI00396A11CF